MRNNYEIFNVNLFIYPFSKQEAVAAPVTSKFSSL